MWARAIELMLGCWLAISPFIFRYTSEPAWPWIHDWIVAFLVITAALFSFWHPTRRAHLFQLVFAGWLVGFRIVTSPPLTPASQNHMVVGLLLMMLAVIPSNSSYPPEAWEKFTVEQKERET